MDTFLATLPNNKAAYDVKGQHLLSPERNLHSFAFSQA